MNAEGAHRSDRAEASLLPPAVTRRGSPAARVVELGMVPPYKVRPSPIKIAVPAEPVSQTETIAIQPPEPSESAVPPVPEPVMELVEFGAAIEEVPTTESSSDADPWGNEQIVPTVDDLAPLELDMPWQEATLEATIDSAPVTEDEEQVEFFAGDIALEPEPQLDEGTTEESIPFEAFLLTEEIEQLPADPIAIVEQMLTSGEPIAVTGPEPALVQAQDQLVPLAPQDEPIFIPANDELNIVPPHHELADRLEKLSQRLRAEELEALLPSLARGDHLDTLVAGFLAGYISARGS